MASADGKVRTVEEEQEEEGVEDVVEIKENPLDIMRYIDAVRDSSAGAIATFSGTTRDTFEGQEVLELRYEAHKSMAYRELRRICQAAREQWDLKRMAVAHRTGVVTIGQESVFIAVSSIHRQDALQACQFVIDEIKARVPIWKKEIYNNGEAWKQNPEFLTRNAPFTQKSNPIVSRLRLPLDNIDGKIVDATFLLLQNVSIQCLSSVHD